ncbi:MAG: Kynurenine formamidase, bacterial [uncultured Thermomicrobiales bacterium]|uniref:Kynurenine formamidase, bacterial n=1 Tax=uncultured Thermomicrobiales bacterium TaxID=1645740 RepID=A0A6J4VH01_9BACT|nr:MAG: Kynurenine formamidase, bacterial [uncultured Thermomicrobiales bacterium]
MTDVDPAANAVVREGRERPDADTAGARLVDLGLGLVVEAGMITSKWVPAPIVCDFLGWEQSSAHYAAGTGFPTGKIELVGNTGTCLDSPFHRFADGKDLAALELSSLAVLDAVVVRATGLASRAIGRDAVAAALGGAGVRGRAVLVETGWDREWRTDRSFEGHPFLTADAADALLWAGAALVGIDSYNVDDTDDGRRPVHTALLGAEITIVEHLRGLEQLPPAGFRFSAVPIKVTGMGTFPARAYANLGASADCG